MIPSVTGNYSSLTRVGTFKFCLDACTGSIGRLITIMAASELYFWPTLNSLATASKVRKSPIYTPHYTAERTHKSIYSLHCANINVT